MLICIFVLIILGVLLLRKKGLWDVKVGPLKVKTIASIVVWTIIFFMVGPIFALILIFPFVVIPWFYRMYYKDTKKEVN